MDNADYAIKRRQHVNRPLQFYRYETPVELIEMTGEFSTNYNGSKSKRLDEISLINDELMEELDANDPFSNPS